MHKPYKGFSNYVEYVQEEFKAGYAEGLALFLKMKKLGLKPVSVDGGYFLPLEITEETKRLIPQKYFALSDYEDDPSSRVIKKDFAALGRVPLDYAFCRWLTIEKGLTLMPVTCFQIDESEQLIENYVRLSICKPKEFFTDPELLRRAEVFY